MSKHTTITAAEAADRGTVGANDGRRAVLRMKNEYKEFKDFVSSRLERNDMLWPDEVRESFWLNLAIWLVLLGLMLLGLVALVWLFFFY